ncbi:MAG TPA: ferrochelatase [Terriglobales bacterium]|nr:ferrochelatase [Terriglobales bacterium]
MATNANSKRAVLLLAHGSPERVEDIPEFLRYVTGGRGLPEAVVKEVQHRYALIGSSPLTRLTLQQADLVQRELGLPTYVGMRNWMPFTSTAIANMQANGVEQAVAICLAPHNSRTSVGLYRKSLEGAPFPIDFVESWHDHPLLIKAFVEKLTAGYAKACNDAGTKLPVIFTAHSVPKRTVDEGDPYECQAVHTGKLVADAAGMDVAMCRFAFQSQGMSGGAWLGPTVEDTIVQLNQAGHSGVFLQPIGFVCDHVEILFDIDIMFRQFAEQRGMKLWRAESLNDSVTFAKAVADVARERFNEQGRDVSPVLREDSK